tara:strand:+ start:37198 stop:39126 length:1929 start_codon:yes stop_codon:yes gene_type:complete
MLPITLRFNYKYNKQNVVENTKQLLNAPFHVLPKDAAEYQFLCDNKIDSDIFNQATIHIMLGEVPKKNSDGTDKPDMWQPKDRLEYLYLMSAVLNSQDVATYTHLQQAILFNLTNHYLQQSKALSRGAGMFMPGPNRSQFFIYEYAGKIVTPLEARYAVEFLGMAAIVHKLITGVITCVDDQRITCAQLMHIISEQFQRLNTTNFRHIDKKHFEGIEAIHRSYFSQTTKRAFSTDMQTNYRQLHDIMRTKLTELGQKQIWDNKYAPPPGPGTYVNPYTEEDYRQLTAPNIDALDTGTFTNPFFKDDETPQQPVALDATGPDSPATSPRTRRASAANHGFAATALVQAGISPALRTAPSPGQDSFLNTVILDPKLIATHQYRAGIYAYHKIYVETASTAAEGDYDDLADISPRHQPNRETYRTDPLDWLQQCFDTHYQQDCINRPHELNMLFALHMLLLKYTESAAANCFYTKIYDEWYQDAKYAYQTYQEMLKALDNTMPDELITSTLDAMKEDEGCLNAIIQLNLQPEPKWLTQFIHITPITNLINAAQHYQGSNPPAVAIYLHLAETLTSFPHYQYAFIFQRWVLLNSTTLQKHGLQTEMWKQFAILNTEIFAHFIPAASASAMAGAKTQIALLKSHVNK